MTSLAPAPTTPVPAGTYSAPTLLPLTLVARGTQILDGLWLTVRDIGQCGTPWHSPMCAVFHFDIGRLAHLPLSAERWIRHPVSSP